MAGRPSGNDGRLRVMPCEPQDLLLAACRARSEAGFWHYRHLGAFAGRRGGKTKTGGRIASEKLTLPNSIGWACAPTYDELHDYVLPAVFEATPEAWIDDWSAEYRELRVRGGAICRFRSLDDPERSRGSGLDWIWMDEARKISRLAWKTAAPALIDRRGQAIITTSPNYHDWCWEDFWVPAVEGRPGYWAIKYRSEDNPYLDPEEIEHTRAGMDPLFARQELDAEFVAMTAAVFGNVLEPCVLTKPEEILRVWPTYPTRDRTAEAWTGNDPGADHPWATVLAFQNRHGLIACGEYEARNRTIIEHLTSVRQLEHPFDVVARAIDKSQRQTRLELARSHNFATVEAGGDLEARIRLMQAWMARRKLFLIQPLVPRLCEQLRGYRWADNENKFGEARSRERVVKINDDLVDALGYLLEIGPPVPEDGVIQVGGPRPIESFPLDQQWQIARLRECEAIRRGEKEPEPRDIELVLEDDQLQVHGEDFWL